MYLRETRPETDRQHCFTIYRATEMSAIFKRIPLSALHLWDKNPRTIKDKRFKAPCKSLTDDPAFMELRPILATKEGRIYAGNMRYRAAEHLGWKDIPAVITDIDDKLANERAIKDNNEFGEWNNDDLSALLDQMEKDGTDIASLGLDESIEKIIEQLNEAEIVEDEVPEPKKDPQTKLGDLWILGNHRLLCGDSTKIDDVERLMNGEKADMVFTDPPYGVDYDGGHAEKAKRREKLENDDETGMYAGSLPLAYAYTVDSAPLYLWFADRFAKDVLNALEENDYQVRTWIIWNKNIAQFGAIGAQYKTKHEPVIYAFKKGKTPTWNGPTNEVTVWDVDRHSKNDFHPTQKPVELAARAIKNHKPDSVLDLFGGSGSTLIACEQLNRKCYMIELDPQYVRVIIDRWEKLTGKKSVLESTGK